MSPQFEAIWKTKLARRKVFPGGVCQGFGENMRCLELKLGQVEKTVVT
jgi:hypothetical protein